MIVCCDTSSIIRLYKGEALSILTRLFSEIYIPEAVQKECRNKTLQAIILEPPFKICPVESVLPLGMGLGEREAISLALEKNIKFFITNDLKPFKKAESLGLSVLTAEKILLLAKRAGFIDSVKTVLEKIRDTGEGIDEGLYSETLRLAGELD